MMNPERKNPNSVWFSWVGKAVDSPQAKSITDRFENRPAVEFYDLSIDPFELKNLAGDPAYATRIGEFKQKLQQWMAAQGDKGAEMDIVYRRLP